MTDWQEETYDQVFEAACDYAVMRRAAEPDFGIQALQDLLDVEYTREGLEWAGKDTVQEVRLNATIAAYEHILAEWKRESEGSS